jgi:two-component system NtrC family sensor kinase
MEKTTWLERQVKALHSITQAISSSRTQKEILEVTLERICIELDFKAATIRLFDEERQQLDLKAAYGLSASYAAGGPVDVALGGIDRVVLTGRHVSLRDIGEQPGSPLAAVARREGLGALLAIPVTFQGRVIGSLHVYKAEAYEFTAEEESLMKVIANLCAHALARTDRFEAFRRVTHNINSTLELREVLTTLLLESVNELNVRAGSIRLLGPDRRHLHLVAAYGLSETYLQKGIVTVSQSPIDQKILQGSHPIAIDDVESGFQYPEEARREGIRSVIVLPLRLKETTIGVMRLYSSQVRRLSEDQVTFAMALADLGALAIENAKLHLVVKERLEALKEDVNGWYRFLVFG